MSVINLESKASSLKETWAPLIVADVNNTAIKVARVCGEFVWHEHEHEDEAFLILKGQLTILYEDKEVVLNTGDLHVVPKGTRHCPKATSDCLIALIELNTTAHTGKLQSTLTRSLEQQRDDI